MKISDHLMRIERIEKTMLDKLDRDADYELYLETCMLASTSALNLILHVLGLTREDWDLLHTHKPVLPFPVPEDLKPLFAGLKFNEDIRPGYLRGTNPWNPADGDACLASYREMKAHALKLLAEKGLAH